MKCKICYFYQEDKCILNKNTSLSFFCSTFIRKIHGIDATEKYLDIVYGRKQNIRVLTVSIFSLLISLSILILKVIDAIKEP